MRKPVHKPQASNWYLQKSFYKRYMTHELTCVPIALYILNLMAGVSALAGSAFRWAAWVQMQKTPLMLLLLIFCLAGALWHSYTWFETTPKVMKVQQGDRFLPEKVILMAHWVVFAVLAIILLGIAIACA